MVHNTLCYINGSYDENHIRNCMVNTPLPIAFLLLNCEGGRKKERTVDLVVKAALNGFKAFDTGEILDESIQHPV